MSLDGTWNHCVLICVLILSQMCNQMKTRLAIPDFLFLSRYQFNSEYTICWQYYFTSNMLFTSQILCFHVLQSSMITLFRCLCFLKIVLLILSQVEISHLSRYCGVYSLLWVFIFLHLICGLTFQTLVYYFTHRGVKYFDWIPMWILDYWIGEVEVIVQWSGKWNQSYTFATLWNWDGVEGFFLNFFILF